MYRQVFTHWLILSSCFFWIILHKEWCSLLSVFSLFILFIGIDRQTDAYIHTHAHIVYLSLSLSLICFLSFFHFFFSLSLITHLFSLSLSLSLFLSQFIYFSLSFSLALFLSLSFSLSRLHQCYINTSTIKINDKIQRIIGLNAPWHIQKQGKIIRTYMKSTYMCVCVCVCGGVCVCK